MGRDQGMVNCSRFGTQSSPAGEAPNFPLPPNPSYVAARGLTGEILSEPSLYEETEKLLNLAQTAGEDTLSHQAGSGPLHQIPDSLEGRLHSEFSWMGNSGRSSFRDLSVKELKQLQKAMHDQPEGPTSNPVIDTQGHDESYGDEYLLSDAMYQPRKAAQQSATLNEVVKDDARQAEIPSGNLAILPSGKVIVGSAAGGDSGKREAGARIGSDPQATSTLEHGGLQSSSIREPQATSNLDYGGLQSSSSCEVNLEASLRDGPFRPGSYMDESSLASSIGPESADASRLTALAKGKMVVRSAENNAEDELLTEGDENEGGEWETLGESGMHSKLGNHASIGRDTSGSSLANVSSIDSTEDNRSAATLWDPLMSHPVIITPPTKAVIHQRSGHGAGVQAPAIVPRHALQNSDGRDAQTLNRVSSSTPALTFSATPRHQIQRGNFPSYRHPTPLSQQHQNPFISSPPSVEVQAPGASYELSEFRDKHNDKRHAISAVSSRSPYQQIHKLIPQEFENRLKNSSAAQDTSSDTSQDGSFSTISPTHLPVDRSSILNPNPSHTPKSAKSFTRDSIKRTETYFTGSPRRKSVCTNLKY